MTRYASNIVATTALALLVFTSSACADDIASLFNTGVDVAGVPLADDAPDPHWTLVDPSPVTGTPLVATSAGGFPIGPWVEDNDISAWTTTLETNASGPGSNTDAGEFADFHYETSFSLAGLDPSTAVLEARVAYDNFLQDVLINGSSAGISFPADNPGGSFQSFTDIAFDENAIGLLTGGDNTMTFIVRSAQADGADDFTGFRAEWTTKTAVPEPASFTLTGIAALFLCVRCRRRTR